MTNINLNINPAVPESSEKDRSGTLKERPTVVEGNVDAFGERVLKLAGHEMHQVPGLPQSLDRLHQSLPSPQHPPASPEK